MTLNLLTIQAILLALYITNGPGISSDAQEIVPNASEKDIENSLRIMKKLKTTRDGLESLKEVLNDIDDDLRRQQHIRSSACAVSGGMSEHCLDELLSSQLDLEEFLQGGHSPGRRQLHQQRKRTSLPATSAQRNSLANINRKRKGLDILRKILSEMDSDLLTQQKRTCAIDLGGHCATESAAEAANQWMYLQSAFSPGKRRRRETSTILRKLMDKQG